jgi:HEAT repeat protein
LQKALATNDPHEKKSIIAALGRSATRASVPELGRLVPDPIVGDTAAYALANAPSESADDELEKLLAQPASARRAARAAIVRAYRRDSAPSRLLDTLERFAKSGEASARAVGVYGLALFSKERCVEFLKAKDAVAVQAAARAAPFVGAARDALERLSTEPPGPTRTQLALGLVDRDARRRVPVRTLLELVEEGSAAAPLALFALGARDSEETRPRLVEFASAPDALLRSALNLGLGDSATPSARSLLATNYLFEPEAEVRRAEVVALGRRHEPSRLATLELAAQLDPDARVREAARLAGANVTSSTFTAGRAALWLALENPEPTSIAVAYVGVPAGLVLPAVADPDGIVLLAGLPEGKLSLRLALEPRERKAPAEERSHATFQR